MKNILKLIGIITITVIIGFGIIACGSSPKDAGETLLPDDSSAIVYFLGAMDVIIWDGETPVGQQGAMPVTIGYRATPGTHYFMVHRFNWVKVKLEVEPNNVYYYLIRSIPNPVPFSKAITAVDTEVEDKDIQAWSRYKTVTFDDKWREKFLKDQKKKYMEEVRENLLDAQK